MHDDPLISAIYADAQTRLREPSHLRQMVVALDQIDWFSAQKDGLGDLYEGLLEKNANETKSGAGQYFTPRALINTMVRCLKPRTGERIQDPAAGTAGFLIAAHEYIKSQTDDLYELSDRDKTFQTTQAYTGIFYAQGVKTNVLFLQRGEPPKATPSTLPGSRTATASTQPTCRSRVYWRERQWVSWCRWWVSWMP